MREKIICKTLNALTVKEIYELSHMKGIKLCDIAKEYHCSVANVRDIRRK